MLKISHSRAPLLAMLAFALLSTGALGCANANYVDTCGGYDCNDYKEFQGYQSYTADENKAMNAKKAKEAREAQESQKEKEREELEAFQKRTRAQTLSNRPPATATGNSGSHCCINGQFYDCDAPDAAEACIETVDPGTCVADANRNHECP